MKTVYLTSEEWRRMRVASAVKNLTCYTSPIGIDLPEYINGYVRIELIGEPFYDGMSACFLRMSEHEFDAFVEQVKSAYREADIKYRIARDFPSPNPVNISKLDFNDWLWVNCH